MMLCICCPRCCCINLTINALPRGLFVVSNSIGIRSLLLSCCYKACINLCFWNHFLPFLFLSLYRPSPRRVVGDMVDDIDMKRKRSLAMVTGRTDTETDMGPARRPLQPQRSRSSRVC